MFGSIETNVFPNIYCTTHTCWNAEGIQSLIIHGPDTMFKDGLGIDVEHMSSITLPSIQTRGLGSFP